ncbi:putative reverse transcriptase domain-containing protein [Tanacetum coccineum]
MDQKVRTYAASQADNKRSEKREYAETLPLCNKSKLHHNGPCTVKCTKCKRVGHLTRECRVPTAAANQSAPMANQRNMVTCYECGKLGHYKSDCPKLKIQNRGNAAGSGEARGRVYALGGRDANQDPNVVTSMFLFNKRYDSILFDTGADMSFVSIAFSSLIDIAPSALDNKYDVELADGKIIGVDTIIHGCTLNLLNNPFNIDLMPVELSSFDVIIGDMSDGRRESRLNILSCTKTQKYLQKGCHVFLAHITEKKPKDKSEEKRLENMPTVRDFLKVFPRDLPGVTPPNYDTQRNTTLGCYFIIHAHESW